MCCDLVAQQGQRQVDEHEWERVEKHANTFSERLV
jgi:hypothetical protein